jgi:hypothetical protein
MLENVPRESWQKAESNPFLFSLLPLTHASPRKKGTRKEQERNKKMTGSTPPPACCLIEGLSGQTITRPPGSING